MCSPMISPGTGCPVAHQRRLVSFLEYQAVLTDVMASVRRHVRAPWYAVGQSTGGAILIDYLLTNHHDRENLGLS